MCAQTRFNRSGKGCLTPSARARNFNSSFVAIGRHPSAAMSHRAELLQADALQERRHEAPEIRNGWLSVAAGMKVPETA
jgi:hypothetical protein